MQYFRSEGFFVRECLRCAYSSSILHYLWRSRLVFSQREREMYIYYCIMFNISSLLRTCVTCEFSCTEMTCCVELVGCSAAPQATFFVSITSSASSGQRRSAKQTKKWKKSLLQRRRRKKRRRESIAPAYRWVSSLTDVEDVLFCERVARGFWFVRGGVFILNYFSKFSNLENLHPKSDFFVCLNGK